MRRNAVQEKSYVFALEIISLARSMQKSREYVLSKQLLRSGTSVGANIEEALQAQSKKDFISKLSIAHKEAFEAHYWLRLIVDGGYMKIDAVKPAMALAKEVLALLTAILKKAKQNSQYALNIKSIFNYQFSIFNLYSSSMDIRYQITGGVPLQGEVTVSGSKNAALPMIAGSVLVAGETVLHNVPRLRDTEIMLTILEYLGATTSFENGTMRIDTTNLVSKPIPHDYVKKLRGSIVLLGPLLARFGVVEMAYPGGCVLGKRPVEAHVLALEQMGAINMSTPEVLHLQGELKPSRVILPEFSVTATENALWAAALLSGETRIDMAAAEPHVQECARMAIAMGAEVEGIGSHTLIIRGRPDLRPVAHRVPMDYLEAGCFVIAALVTKGKLRIKDFDYEHLVSFLDTIRRAGGIWRYSPDERTLLVDGEISILNSLKVQTMIFPGFPTDLQAPMGVLMSQAHGVSRIQEVLFEGRLAYLYELEKMGAQVEILNSHEALVIGPTPLKGRLVASNDIRAGAAMVLAGLCAEGNTTITDVHYIERGYDKLDEKLRSLGAKIERQVIEKA